MNGILFSPKRQEGRWGSAQKTCHHRGDKTSVHYRTKNRLFSIGDSVIDTGPKTIGLTKLKTCCLVHSAANTCTWAERCISGSGTTGECEVKRSQHYCVQRQHMFSLLPDIVISSVSSMQFKNRHDTCVVCQFSYSYRVRSLNVT